VEYAGKEVLRSLMMPETPREDRLREGKIRGTRREEHYLEELDGENPAEKKEMKRPEGCSPERLRTEGARRSRFAQDPSEKVGKGPRKTRKKLTRRRRALNSRGKSLVTTKKSTFANSDYAVDLGGELR